MFLEAAEIFPLHLRADREGNWKLHLNSSSSMLPYFVLANKTNYCKWTPWYVLNMLRTPKSAKEAFEKGHFTIRHKQGSFNGTYADMAT